MFSKRRLDNQRDAAMLKGRRIVTLRALRASFLLFTKKHKGNIVVNVKAYENPMVVTVDGMRHEIHGLGHYCCLDIQDLPATLAMILDVLGVTYSRGTLRNLCGIARDILSTVAIEKEPGQQAVVKAYRIFTPGPRIVRM